MLSRKSSKRIRYIYSGMREVSSICSNYAVCHCLGRDISHVVYGSCATHRLTVDSLVVLDKDKFVIPMGMIVRLNALVEVAP